MEHVSNQYVAFWNGSLALMATPSDALPGNFVPDNNSSSSFRRGMIQWDPRPISSFGSPGSSTNQIAQSFNSSLEGDDEYDLTSFLLPSNPHNSNNGVYWPVDVTVDPTTTTTTRLINGVDETSGRYSVLQTCVLIVVLGFLTVGTIVGNILVCVAVCMVRKLRKPSNYLLVSLAVSDLCVAILVMPIAAVYELSGAWPLGNFLCDLWVVFDVLTCSASM